MTREDVELEAAFKDAEEMPPELRPEEGEAKAKARNLARLEELWGPLLEKGADWLETTPPPRKYLLRADEEDKVDGETIPRRVGFLPMGIVGMMAAAGGAGKSWALLQLALTVAAADPRNPAASKWLETFPVSTTGRVLLAFGEENEEEIRRRLYHAARLAGLDAAARGRVGRNLYVLPLRGVDLTLVNEEGNGTDFEAALLAKLNDGGEPWALVIVDPLSRWAGLDAEKDNARATRFVEALERMTAADLGGPAVLFAHHTRKDERGGTSSAESARGSSAFVDGARWAVGLDPYVKTWKQSGIREALSVRLPGCSRLHVTKANYSRFLDHPVELAADRDHDGALRPMGAKELERLQALCDAEIEDARRKKKDEPSAAPETTRKRGGKKDSLIGADDVP